ncbi:5'-methylthioadenosine/S-adenosylhomocysteine nucleosidase [Actinoplanes sp. DH11]|uniref:5'-methylthioadenosine/S-adenosylhomocysteine nucleosidase family protein n=1 Tax=Actinoplanes sp. DH11 TaxID=2857011 RepID=UPI001E50AF4B|nr:5'-methylthioadenosine/S-adenosylhomocysteine nucleosidase [Actinoplanes sp. DH11]
MIVVLVALEVERQEVRRRLLDVRVERHEAGTHFDMGVVRGRDGRSARIALALAGRGSSAAGVIAERAISRYQPRAVLFVGVAGGLRDWLALGDVVVATKIYAYHGGRSEDAGFRAYPQAWNIPHEIDQAARHLALGDDWFPEPQRRPRVHFEPVAVGEVVVNGRDAPEIELLHKTYADAVAVEMESAGAAHAGHVNRTVPTAAIRGISDHAGGRKDHTDAEGWQPVAAANAATFALALALELDLDDDSGTPASTGPADPGGTAGPRYTVTSHGENSPAIQQNKTTTGDIHLDYRRGAS